MIELRAIYRATPPKTCAASEQKAPHEFDTASPWPPASLARPWLSFRCLFGCLLRLHGLRYLFALFSVACFACTALVIFFVLFSAARFACTALVIFSLSFLVSWGPLRSLFAALGCSWGSLGHSWATLGRSWDALGRLLAALGPLLGRHVKIDEKSMPKMTDFGSEKGAQREPKSNPKPTKIEDKNRCEKNSSSRSSWSRLGAILGHFGGHLGSQKSSETVCFKRFRENPRFSKNSVSRAVLSPTWAILGRFWPPKWLQDELQKRPKTIKKRC